MRGTHNINNWQNCMLLILISRDPTEVALRHDINKIVIGLVETTKAELRDFRDDRTKYNYLKGLAIMEETS